MEYKGKTLVRIQPWRTMQRVPLRTLRGVKVTFPRGLILFYVALADWSCTRLKPEQYWFDSSGSHLRMVGKASRWSHTPFQTGSIPVSATNCRRHAAMLLPDGDPDTMSLNWYNAFMAKRLTHPAFNRRGPGSTPGESTSGVEYPPWSCLQNLHIMAMLVPWRVQVAVNHPHIR